MKINRDALRHTLLKTAYQAVCADKQKQFETLQAVLTFAQANRQAGNGNQTEQQAKLVLDVMQQRDVFLEVANEVETLLRNMMADYPAQHYQGYPVTFELAGCLAMEIACQPQFIEAARQLLKQE